MNVVFVWVEGASPRLAKAQVLLEESIHAWGLRPVRYPAGKRLCLFGDVLSCGREGVRDEAFVWCNSDVILTKNPFEVPNPGQVYGFRRKEIPSGEIGHGVDMYHIPVAIWDQKLSRDVPDLYVGSSYVDWWISRAMPLYGNYENLVGYIDHPSHQKSEAANNDADPYYQANFKAYNRWAKRHGVESISAPPFLVPGLGHVWGVRDAFKRLQTKWRLAE